MIGTSLPFAWLLSGGTPLSDIPTVLDTLKSHGVESAELRTVRHDTNPDDVLRAAHLLWDAGFQITVHASVRHMETAAEDVYAPLAHLFAKNRQERVTITVHPCTGSNAELLSALSGYADAHGYPVMIALENNRTLPDGSEGDSTALVYDAVRAARAAGCRNVGICFDFGHYAYYVWKNRPDAPELLPPGDFFLYVVHTHIHALNGLRTHFPLTDAYELPLTRMVGALCHGYFGVYNLELDFPRFDAVCEPLPALYASVDALTSAMPHCARLYDDLRTNLDQRLLHALTMYDTTAPGTRFALLQSASYLFSTDGFHWGMDITFRFARRLCKTPHRLAELLAPLDLMLISHGHDDHFEEATVRQLASTGMRWIIPHFLVGTALSWGVKPEHIIPAYEGQAITVGPLTVLPFAGRHFRPGTNNGIAELGYRVSAEGSPSLIFPVDTRDYAVDTMPDIPEADYCFANIWLGDSAAFADDYADIGSRFADFMLRLSKKHIIFSHMYENGREDRDMWRWEHAEVLSAIINEKSPGTECVVPVPGEIIMLKTDQPEV